MFRLKHEHRELKLAAQEQIQNLESVNAEQGELLKKLKADQEHGLEEKENIRMQFEKMSSEKEALEKEVTDCFSYVCF